MDLRQVSTLNGFDESFIEFFVLLRLANALKRAPEAQQKREQESINMKGTLLVSHFNSMMAMISSSRTESGRPILCSLRILFILYPTGFRRTKYLRCTSRWFDTYSLDGSIDALTLMNLVRA